MDFALVISLFLSVIGLRTSIATPLTPATTTEKSNRSGSRVLVRLEEKIRGMEAMTFAVKLSRMEYIIEQMSRRVENMETKLNAMEIKLDVRLEKIEQAISNRERHSHSNRHNEDIIERVLNKLNSIEARINVHVDNLSSKVERNERKLDDSLADISDKLDKTDKFNDYLTTQTAKSENLLAEVHSYVKEEFTEYLSQRLTEIGTKVENGFQQAEKQVQTEMELLTGIKQNVQRGNNHLQTAVQHLESMTNHTCANRARGGVEQKAFTDSDITNLTDVMMASMQFGERKFKELDNDMEVYTRKVLNTYQELLKSFRERENRIDQILKDNNQTRHAVIDAFRRLQQQIRPFTAMQAKIDEMVDGLHHKITELDDSLDSSFASLLIAQNTFITSCHRVQVQEPQIEHKIYNLMQQFVSRNMDNNSRTNTDTSDDLVYSLLNNHHLQVGRAMNDVVWSIVNIGNQSRDDMQKVMNKLNSLQQDSSSCMIKVGEWESLTKACEAVKIKNNNKRVKAKVNAELIEKLLTDEEAESIGMVNDNTSDISRSRRKQKTNQRTKGRFSDSRTYMNDGGNYEHSEEDYDDDYTDDYETAK